MPRRTLVASSSRFLLLGGANTLATASLVVVLSLIVPTTVAFTIAFALGLTFSVATTGRFVFGVTSTRKQRLQFTLAYVTIYVSGLGMARLLEMADVVPLARAATVVVTAPMSFIAGRLIFERRDMEIL